MKIPSSDLFYNLSADLTGFTVFELHGTGVGEKYLDALVINVGEDVATELFRTYRMIVRESAEGSEERKGRLVELLQDSKLGPVGRNLISMWYLGSWYFLDKAWYEAYAPTLEEQAAQDTYVVAAQTYVESLVWRAMKAHPMGAKQQGYATWSQPVEEERV